MDTAAPDDVRARGTDHESAARPWSDGERRGGAVPGVGAGEQRRPL